eukprot:Rmarinus@m.5658
MLSTYNITSVVFFAIAVGPAYTYATSWIKFLQFMLGDTLSILACINLFVNIGLVSSKAVVAFFFEGHLRQLESQDLGKLARSYLIMKVFLWCTIVEAEAPEILLWSIWHCSILCLKLLRLLCRIRLEYMVVFPGPSPVSFSRKVGLLALVWLCNLGLMAAAYDLFSAGGWGLLMLLCYDNITLFIESTHSLLKYGLRLVPSSDETREGWDVEEYVGWRYYLDLIADIAHNCVTLVNISHLWLITGVSYTLFHFVSFSYFRDAIVFIARRLRSHWRFKKTMHELDGLLTSATDDDIRNFNDDCAICRAPMHSAKRLPCGHLFHKSCLRPWLQQRSSCPSCRQVIGTGVQSSPNEPTTEPANDPAAHAQRHTDIRPGAPDSTIPRGSVASGMESTPQGGGIGEQQPSPGLPSDYMGATGTEDSRQLPQRIPEPVETIRADDAFHWTDIFSFLPSINIGFELHTHGQTRPAQARGGGTERNASRAYRRFEWVWGMPNTGPQRTEEEELAILEEMFPNQTPESLLDELRSSGSLQDTIDMLLGAAN